MELSWPALVNNILVRSTVWPGPHMIRCKLFLVEQICVLLCGILHSIVHRPLLGVTPLPWMPLPGLLMEQRWPLLHREAWYECGVLLPGKSCMVCIWMPRF